MIIEGRLLVEVSIHSTMSVFRSVIIHLAVRQVSRSSLGNICCRKSPDLNQVGNLFAWFALGIVTNPLHKVIFSICSELSLEESCKNV